MQVCPPPHIDKKYQWSQNEESIKHYACASKARVKRMNNILLNPFLNIPEYSEPREKISKTQPGTPTIQLIPSTQPFEPGTNVTKNHSEMTKNHTAISGLLQSSTLNICTFNITYPLTKFN